jgi:hypothetical protein
MEFASDVVPRCNPAPFSPKGEFQDQADDERSVTMVPGPYGKGYPRTDESFMRARHARPLYALWAGGLRLSSSPLDTPSRTGLVPCPAGDLPLVDRKPAGRF